MSTVSDRSVPWRSTKQWRCGSLLITRRSTSAPSTASRTRCTHAHTYRQFYRKCNIVGTIDYMSGNGYAVFQRCVLTANKSGILGQFNTYTAQGRSDVNMKTGLSF